MPTFLSDPSPTVYAIVVIMVAVLAGFYLRSRKRKDLYPFIGGVAVLVALFVIDRLVESPREEATRKMQEISAATKAKKTDDLGKHVSESFEYKHGMKKAQLLEFAKVVFARGEFSGVDMTGFSRNDFEKIDDSRVKVGFETWPTGYGLPEYRYFCWATFVKDPDGQFRMQTFDLYKGKPGPNDQPVALPALP